MLHFEIFIQRTNQESIWSLGYWKHFDKQRFWKLNCIIQYKRCALNALLSSFSPNSWVQYNYMIFHVIIYIELSFILSWITQRWQGPSPFACSALVCTYTPTWSVLSVHCPCPPHIDWLPGLAPPGLANHPVSAQWPGAAADVTAGPQLPGLGSDLQNRVILRLRRPRPAPAPSHARPQPGHQRSSGRCHNKRGLRKSPQVLVK